MSTKIYTGRRYKATTLYELDEFRKKVRETLMPVARELYNKAFAKKFISKYDKATIANEEINTRTMKFNVWQELGQLMKKHSDSEYNGTWADFTFSMSIMIDGDYLLLMPFSQYDSDYLAALDSIEGVEEYGYWNNTDPLDTVTDEEWQERGEAWDRVLPGAGIPLENGFTFELFSLFSVNRKPSDDILNEYIANRTFDERVKYIAGEKFIQEQEKAFHGFQGSPSEYMNESCKWRKDNQALRDTLTQQVSNSLTETIVV